MNVTAYIVKIPASPIYCAKEYESWKRKTSKKNEYRVARKLSF